MTDAERIRTIKHILDEINNPKHRDDGSMHTVLVNRTNQKEYKSYINNKSSDTERFFAISGKDVYESGCQWSCGTLAKSFCYKNSIVDKDKVGTGEDNFKPLEVKIMISVHPDHLIDAYVAHTLPCIKMGNGKWYAIEPNQKSTVKNYPQNPDYQGVPFLLDEIKIGNKVHHILDGIDVPYEITAFMTYDEYRKKTSKFSDFLKYASKRDKSTIFICSKLETALKNIDIKKHIGKIYDFCKQIQTSKLPIKIMHVKKEDREFTVMTVNFEGGLYYFSVSDYLDMHKFRIKNKKAVVRGEQCDILWQKTPKQYIKMYENKMQSNINQMPER